MSHWSLDADSLAKLLTAATASQESYIWAEKIKFFKTKKKFNMADQLGSKRNVQFGLHQKVNLLHFCLLTVLWFGLKPFHCLPVTMWTNLSQRRNRTNTSSFFCYIGKVFMHWAHLIFIFNWLLLSFCTFASFERKPCWRNSFIVWLYKWRRGGARF